MSKKDYEKFKQNLQVNLVIITVKTTVQNGIALHPKTCYSWSLVSQSCSLQEAESTVSPSLSDAEKSGDSSSGILFGFFTPAPHIVPDMQRVLRKMTGE